MTTARILLAGAIAFAVLPAPAYCQRPPYVPPVNPNPRPRDDYNIKDLSDQLSDTLKGTFEPWQNTIVVPADILGKPASPQLEPLRPEINRARPVEPRLALPPSPIGATGYIFGDSAALGVTSTPLSFPQRVRVNEFFPVTTTVANASPKTVQVDVTLYASGSAQIVVDQPTKSVVLQPQESKVVKFVAASQAPGQFTLEKGIKSQIVEDNDAPSCLINDAPRRELN